MEWKPITDLGFKQLKKLSVMNNISLLQNGNSYKKFPPLIGEKVSNK